MSRESKNVIFGIKENKGRLVTIGVSCETDFVANTELFRDLSTNLLTSAVNNSQTLSESTIIKDSNNILFNNVSISDALKTVISKTGENCRLLLSENLQLEKNNILGIYLHGNYNLINFSPQASYTVLSYTKKDMNNTLLDANEIEILKKLAYCLSMQIVAMNPLYINSSDISSSNKDLQISIITERLKNSDKNFVDKKENIVKKIIENSLLKYYEEVCLMEQDFIINSFEHITLDENSSIKVKNLIEKVKVKLNLQELKITCFKHYKV